jgi:hypothetical protein
MLIDVDAAQYLVAVTTAIKAGRKLPQMTNICPECDERVDVFSIDHIVVALPDREVEDITGVAVVIACEGYWVVDPNAVGIRKPNWMRVDEQIADVANAPSDRFPWNRFGPPSERLVHNPQDDALLR